MVDTFERLGNRRVDADVASDNEYSRGLTRKLGFTEGLSVTYFVKEFPAS
jgi:RimJ/RimL family protein N-acetyltransferase